LPNGLTVFLTENMKSPNVVVSHYVRAGSLHEKPGVTGIAHLFEHMMFRPLAPTEPTFFDIAGKLGADYNASTRFESTFYYSIVAPDKLRAMLTAESNRFKKLVVTNELLDAERKAVWSEYSTKMDADPTMDMWTEIYRKAFPGHPYGWTIIGEREDLEKIKAEDCNEFFKKYYRPNNVGLFVTGAFKAHEVLKTIVELYGDWEAGQPSTLPADFTAKTKELVTQGRLPSQSNMIMFGFRVPTYTTAQAEVIELANYILFSSNGLLKRRLVDDKRIAAQTGDFGFSNDNGMLKGIVVALPQVKLEQVRTEVYQLVQDLKSMSADEFTAYKRNFYIESAEGAQRNASLASALAENWGKYNDPGMLHRYLSGPSKVTQQQVTDYISTYFKPDNTVFITPKQQTN
jgi:zinc protease